MCLTRRSGVLPLYYWSVETIRPKGLLAIDESFNFDGRNRQKDKNYEENK